MNNFPKVFFSHILFRNKDSWPYNQCVGVYVHPMAWQQQCLGTPKPTCEFSVSDLMFFAPSHEVAGIQSQVSPVYMFEFAHRSKVTLDRSGWVWSMPTTLCTTLESHYCRIRHSITTRLTKTWACLSWPCTQTLPERVIRHHNQSAVLRWESLTLATELIWRLKSVPRWRHRFILDECPFGMIIIPNWSKWSLMIRKGTQAELALASAWDCLLLSYQSLLTIPFFNHS